MPQHKSARKRVRTNEKRRERNRQVRSRIRTAVRDLDQGPVEEQPELFRRVTSELDVAARKGIVKKSTASRRKSRFAKALNRANAEQS